MSKSLKARVDKLEQEAYQKLENEVFTIWRRYGGNGEAYAQHATPNEKAKVNKYMEYRWPDVVNDFMDEFEIFAPSLYQVLFEHKIYPIILSPNPKREHKNVVLGFDQLYLELTQPSLWKEFFEEIKSSPEFGEEGWDTWTISESLRQRFAVEHAKRDALKDRIRVAKLAEWEKEVELLKEDGDLEAAQELEDELAEIKRIKNE